MNSPQSVPHDNQSPHSNKQRAELSSLGWFLTVVITIVVSLALSMVCGASQPFIFSDGTGDIVDISGRLGSLTGMVCGMSTLVGPITYAVMGKLFPKKLSPSGFPSTALSEVPVQLLLIELLIRQQEDPKPGVGSCLF